MLTTDCPLCNATAHLDVDLTVVDCEGCGTTEIAPDPPRILDAAA